MSDVNAIISLGIGSPAGVPEFLTFGLMHTEEEASSGTSYATDYLWRTNPEVVTVTIVSTDSDTFRRSVQRMSRIALD